MPYFYIDTAYMRLKHDARVLVQLTNDDSRVDEHDFNNIGEQRLMAAENDAAQTVDNYMRDLYTIPLVDGTTLTAEMKSIIAALTWCNLWESKGEESQQVTELRKRMLTRLENMAKPDALETREGKTTQAMPVRSTKGKPRTLFDNAGYFPRELTGVRNLAADTEHTSGTG